MFIWDFVANPVMESILDWFYSQMVGFLGLLRPDGKHGGGAV